MFIGIDPGISGAMALLDAAGRPRALFDTPTLNLETRREYDLAQMRQTLEWVLAEGKTRAALELVHAMPGQGVVSMWRMGYGVGIWEGLLAALKVPVERVSPQRWKGVMLNGLPKGKDASRYRAKALWPEWAERFSLKKHDGRAEACLIAEWLRRTAG